MLGCQSLPFVWRLGREAYVVVAKKLGRNPTVQDFKEIHEETLDIEADHRQGADEAAGYVAEQGV